MITKTVVMLIVYTTPIVLLSLGLITSPAVAVMLFLVSGLGMGGIGMGIMHDANHGSYSKNSKLNTLLSYSLDFLGCSSEMWKFQHNVLHHTYTNIHGHDEDIDAPLFLLRFSPYSKRYKIHRFQHLYVWGFYSVMTLYWITLKDFKKVFEYYKMGLIKTKRESYMHLLKLIPLKLMYFGVTLVLPMIFAPFSPLWILLGFILMHMMAGVMLSMVFQLAHVVPDMKFPQSDDEGKIDESWFTHQLQTTSNFAPKNRFLFWYFGGLTNQIEHHLFPNICHVHYRAISRIVAKTAKDYHLPYYVNKSMFAAIAGHVKTLRVLGRMDMIQQ